MASDVITRREAVGVFPDNEHLMAAIDELQLEEFARQDISVLSGEMEMRKRYSTVQGNIHRIGNDPDAPRGVQLAPEEESLVDAALIGGGILLGTVLSAPIISAMGITDMGFYTVILFAILGGVAGYMLALAFRTVRRERSRSMQRAGGMLLWVNTPTREKEAKATAILSKHGAHDVHVNEVVKAAA